MGPLKRGKLTKKLSALLLVSAILLSNHQVLAQVPTHVDDFEDDVAIKTLAPLPLSQNPSLPARASQIDPASTSGSQGTTVALPSNYSVKPVVHPNNPTTDSNQLTTTASSPLKFTQLPKGDAPQRQSTIPEFEPASQILTTSQYAKEGTNTQASVDSISP